MAFSTAYKRYINSPEWFRKRSRWVEMADYECEWCSKLRSSLHAHHLTYENLFHEKDDDILICCPTCHKHADWIRKCLKRLGDNGAALAIKRKYGYPFGMKRKGRKHVLRMRHELEALEKKLQTLQELKRRMES